MNKLLIALLSLVSISLSHEKGFSFYDGPLLFKPLSANTFEPRVGLIWHANDNRLRLDIGNSIDLVQYGFEHQRRRLVIGSDFFTYTLLRGEKNFHFPVDAVDYLFGFNTSYIDTLDAGVFSGRLRLSHISAHFVDGHFDGTLNRWKDGRYPRVYSREFFDLTLAYEPDQYFRSYCGIVYLWHVDPTWIKRWIGYIGGEGNYPLVSGVSLFGSYQYTASAVRPRHEIHIGATIGSWHGRGTSVFAVFHRGNSIHGEYFDMRDAYSGIGFNIGF